MGKEFEGILNECIERLLRGESVERCLQDYPEQAAELEPLLRVAQATRRAAALEPRPEFKAQLRYQLRSALQAEKRKPWSQRIPVFGWWPRWAVGVVACLLILFIAGGGVVYASSDSLPNDTLYPVKLAVERVQMAFTFSDVSKARLRMKLANRRMQEIARMVERAKPAEEVEEAASELTPRVRILLARVRRLVEAERAKMETQRLLELRQLLQQNAEKSQALLRVIESGAPLRPAIAQFVYESRTGYQQALEAAAAVDMAEPSTDATLEPQSGVIRADADLRSPEVAADSQVQQNVPSTSLSALSRN